LKTSEERAKARQGIQGLKDERSRLNKIRLSIYKKYQIALRDYKTITYKYTGVNRKQQGWYKKSDWDSFKTTCTASGMSSKVCAAKYKMESLYNKYEESKHAWQ
jgi:hypothetical protein